MPTKYIEGVPYYSYLVRYRTTDGKRRRLTFWSPGEPWIRTELGRTLDAMHGIETIVPGSVTYRRAPEKRRPRKRR